MPCAYAYICMGVGLKGGTRNGEWEIWKCGNGEMTLWRGVCRQVTADSAVSKLTGVVQWRVEHLSMVELAKP